MFKNKDDFTVTYKDINNNIQSKTVKASNFKEALNKVFDSKYQIAALEEAVTVEGKGEFREYTRGKVNSLVTTRDDAQFQI